MRILLVQTYLGRREDFLVYPIGLASIGTVAGLKGHEIELFDPNVCAHPYRELRERILRFSPRVVGISLRNIDSQLRIAPFYYYKALQRMLAIIKETYDDAKVVIGGPGFSMFPEKIMDRHPLIDYGIYLEGEESFLELLDNLRNPGSVSGIYFRKGNEVVFSGYRSLPDFKALPFPQRNFSELTPYMNKIQSIGVQTKRGCPHKCLYCNYSQLNGGRIRIRDAKSVCDEIEYLVKELKVTHFMFADAIFNEPREHAESICNEIIKRGLKVNWSAYMGIRGATKDFLQLAMKAGCRDVAFSPDGVSQTALDSLRKGLKEKDVLNNLHLLTSDSDLKRLNVIYSVFINPPGETFRGLIKTIAFYVKAKMSLRGRGTIFLNWIRLEPGTAALHHAIKEGVVAEDIDLLPECERDLKRTFYSHPRLRHLDLFLIFMMKSLRLLKVILRKLKIKKLIGLLGNSTG